MSAWAFTLVRNEAVLIPYWVRHYRTFCERVIVYCDTTSDDGTAEIAEAEGAEVRGYTSPDGLDDGVFTAFANYRYQEARGQAEWVIWTDADEILYHPRMTERLAQLRQLRVDVPWVEGYAMVSDGPPTGKGQIYDEIRRGFPAPAYSKVAIFDPSIGVFWAAGKHKADLPPCRGGGYDDPLKLLHYRYLGEAWHRERNQRNYQRVSEAAHVIGYGKECSPGYEGEYSPEWYAENARRAVACV